MERWQCSHYPKFVQQIRLFYRYFFILLTPIPVFLEEKWIDDSRIAPILEGYAERPPGPLRAILNILPRFYAAEGGSRILEESGAQGVSYEIL